MQYLHRQSWPRSSRIVNASRSISMTRLDHNLFQSDQNLLPKDWVRIDPPQPPSVFMCAQRTNGMNACFARREISKNDSISCAFNLFRPTPGYASRAVWLKHTSRVWCTVPCVSTRCRIVLQQWLSFGRALDRWSVSGGEKRRVMNGTVPVSETETGIVEKNFCQVLVLKNKEHRGLLWLYQ